MNAWIRLAALSWFLTDVVGAALPGGTAWADDRTSHLRIGTGNIVGTYFPLGQALADILSRPVGAPPCDTDDHCGVPGLIAVAQASDGSVANVEAVQSGEFEAALAQANVVDAAFHGTRLFEKHPRAENLRVIANLYPESLHLVVTARSGIQKMQDLKGKRISFDRTTSGTSADAALVLKAYGLKRSDVKNFEDAPTKAGDLLAAGQIDGFFYLTGAPAGLVFDLAEHMPINLVPIGGEPARRLVAQNRFFSVGSIPAGIYKGVPEIETIQVGAQLIVNAKVSADLVYAVTKALWAPANLAALAKNQPQAAQIKPANALQGVSIPLHPGAERYYREIGLIKDGTAAEAPSDRSQSRRP